MSEVSPKCRLPENFPVAPFAYKCCVYAYMCKEQMLVLYFWSSFQVQSSLQSIFSSLVHCRKQPVLASWCLYALKHWGSTEFSGQSLSCTSRVAFACIGWVERPSLYRNEACLLVNKGELGKPWDTFHCQNNRLIDYWMLIAEKKLLDWACAWPVRTVSATPSSSIDLFVVYNKENGLIRILFLQVSCGYTLVLLQLPNPSNIKMVWQILEQMSTCLTLNA